MPTSSKFWDKLSTKYAAKPVDNPAAYQVTLERTQSYLEASDKVLEIGCGTGSTALVLGPHVDSYIGADYSAGMIDIATAKLADRQNPNIEFRQIDMFDHSLEASSYDVITAFSLIHLVEDIPPFLQRVRDLLKPEGLFISKSTCLSEKKGFLKFPLKVAGFFNAVPYVHFLKKTELDTYIEAAGFELVETDDHAGEGESHFVVAKKIPAA